MSRAGFLFVSGFAFLFPLLTHAEQATTWDFRNANVDGKWTVTQTMTATPQADGLHLHANDAGNMTREIDRNSHIDAVRFITKASQSTDASFVWHTDAVLGGNLLNLRTEIQASDTELTTEVDPNYYAEWDHPDTLGIGLPAGADITLVAMQTVHWSPLEKLSEAWKTFWTFDAFKAYTINFLWGPLITFNPIARHQLYYSEPPHAQSANRYFYYFFAIVAIITAIHWFVRGRPRPARKYMMALVGTFAALWLFYDMRMGLEILDYARYDYKTLYATDPANREFRNYKNFYVMVDAILPRLMQEKTYAILVPDQTSLHGMLRYMTMPVLPYESSEDPKDAKVWVVFKMPNVKVDDQGHLTEDGKVLTAPGHVIQQIDDSSFLFEISP